MPKLARPLIVAFAATGLAAATAASYVHYRLLTDPLYMSVCDVSATVNCTQAYLSDYGSMGGIPIALGGVSFFLLVLLVALVGGRAASSVRDVMPSYVFAMTAPALAYVLYLGWASYVRLGVFCILCAITYASVVGIFIVSGRATSFSMSILPRRTFRDLRALATSPLLLLIALLFLGANVTAIAMFPRKAVEEQSPTLTDQQRADLEKWWAAQPERPLPIPNGDARVLIVKFSDYMCPACRQTYEGYKTVLGKYLSGGQVRYVVKHYPLEAECNPAAPSNHYASCEAAAAVVMARPKGTAEKLEQWIFANQPALTPESVRAAAKDIGGIQDFDQQYARALQEVKTDAGLGALLQVKSTPTFFINGRRIDGQVLPPHYFDYLIELALKTAK